MLLIPHSSSLRPVLSDFGRLKVVAILAMFLDGYIFELELKAKVEFPELFLSTERNA